VLSSESPGATANAQAPAPSAHHQQAPARPRSPPAKPADKPRPDQAGHRGWRSSLWLSGLLGRVDRQGQQANINACKGQQVPGHSGSPPSRLKISAGQQALSPTQAPRAAAQPAGPQVGDGAPKVVGTIARVLVPGAWWGLRPHSEQDWENHQALLPTPARPRERPRQQAQRDQGQKLPNGNELGLETLVANGVQDTNHPLSCQSPGGWMPRADLGPGDWQMAHRPICFSRSTSWPRRFSGLRL